MASVVRAKGNDVEALEFNSIDLLAKRIFEFVLSNDSILVFWYEKDNQAITTFLDKLRETQNELLVVESTQHWAPFSYQDSPMVKRIIKKIKIGG